VALLRTCCKRISGLWLITLIPQIEELMGSKPREDPVVNQIEVHPFNTQTGIRDTCAKYGIAIEAYAPLVRGMRMRHPKILSLSQVYGCTPAQLLVKYDPPHRKWSKAGAQAVLQMPCHAVIEG
jgi:hypothetical protein